jgi:hypothetical protein
MPGPYQVGDSVLLATLFAIADVPTDPSTVELTVTEPDGTSTTYSLALGSVSQTGTGAFSKIVVYDAPGVWAWRWVGTGTAAGVDEGTDSVEIPLTTAPGLCTLGDVKLARKGMLDVLDDLVMFEIAAYSAVIADYSGRQFTREPEANRFFRMGRSPEVLIDDLSAIPTEAQVLDAYGNGVATLTVATDLTLLPRTRKAYDPITGLRLLPSVAWGCELRVKGVWGFPAVPPAVRRACVEAVVEALKADSMLTLQSPDQWEPGSPPERGLPLKARDLLRPFRRIGVA